ncbi:MAG: sterol desaturase family protein [Lamprobacter sp.]|uniref:sterol desaturase family protein n=1 Tax=Lamprobacter sp. TaxID=3100796 RepID=UPI002B263D83|nr:sterol desaturase family protein [Lamprobacter sp.]MEA3642879.1 sterol desaturase family protein [Lamprobacter sp.]
MDSFIQTHEAMIRLGFFLGVFALMAIWEVIAPSRARMLTRVQRWSSNIGLVVLNTVLLRLLFPAAAVGMALSVNSAGWGLLNALAWPFWLELLLALLVLDFAIWVQHVLFHAVPALWRLHRVHHADLDYDLTTGARFHPLEIILSMLIKFAVIAALGPPIVAVILFEVILNAMAMFNHANIALPAWVDRPLRWLVVTPDMHRVHHSIEDDETNSNFGFNLSWWDWLLGTYRAQPRAGQQGMTIGIRQHREPRRVDRLDGMLLLPFVGKVTEYAINRRQWADAPEPHEAGAPTQVHKVRETRLDER